MSLSLILVYMLSANFFMLRCFSLHNHDGNGNESKTFHVAKQQFCTFVHFVLYISLTLPVQLRREMTNWKVYREIGVRRSIFIFLSGLENIPSTSSGTEDKLNESA